MLIQAYTMAYNEAEWIRQWVKSALRVCDVATVFDNGSTDRTVELARAAGAEVAHAEPQPEGCRDYNDPRFGHGRRRNACIAQLRGDWILNLDADEVLDGPDGDTLRRLIVAYPQAKAFKFLRYNLWCAEDLYRTDWQSWYPWLWKNGEGVRYGTQDPPHEPLVDAAGRNLLETAVGVPEGVGRIIHYHYVRGWKAQMHLKQTAEGIRQAAEELYRGKDPRVERVPWA